MKVFLNIQEKWRLLQDFSHVHDYIISQWDFVDCYEKKDHVFGHINMQWNAFLPVCSDLESLYYQTKYHIPSHLNKWILNVQFKYKLRASMKVWHPFCFFSSRWVSNLQMSFHNKYIYIYIYIKGYGKRCRSPTVHLLTSRYFKPAPLMAIEMDGWYGKRSDWDNYTYFCSLL
jgi:hypothetical protein